MSRISQLTPEELRLIQDRELARAEKLAQARGLKVKLSDDGFHLIFYAEGSPGTAVPIAL